MQHLNVKSIIAILLASTIMTSSYAEAKTSGAYIDVNAGIPFILWSEPMVGFIAANTNLGYQFNRHLALEAGYTLQKFPEGTLNSVAVLGKVILPITKGQHPVSLYGKLGPAELFNNESHMVVPSMTIGASYQLTNQVDFTAQVQSLGAIDNLILTGITYHF